MVKNPSAETQSAFLAFQVRILDENFDTYEIPRFSWLLKIETVLVDNPEMPPQGCGEPAITTMGGEIANAVYDAIGVRLYVLPMTPARIKEALEKNRMDEEKERSKHLHSAVSLTIRLDSKPI